MTAATHDPGHGPLGWVCCGQDSNSMLALFLGLSLAVHLLVVLGLRIEAPKPSQRKVSTLEVVVVRLPQPSPALPDTDSAAAQVTQGGSGAESRDAIRPPEEIDGPPDPVLAGIAALGLDPHEPPPETVPEPTPEAIPGPTPDALPEEAPPVPQPMRQDTEILTTEVRPTDPKTLPLQPARPQASPPPVTAAQILASRNQELTHLASRDEEKTSVFGNRPRRKAISSSTREYKYATYLEGWRRKVEQVGNLNYPDEARRKQLYGNLILRVAVRADGSVEQIQVLRSSGFPVLDQAATHIVELSAPFAPFPADIKADTDVLDITRTWQFQRNNQIGWGN
jgi:periplasmic protein TonB